MGNYMSQEPMGEGEIPVQSRHPGEQMPRERDTEYLRQFHQRTSKGVRKFDHRNDQNNMTSDAVSSDSYDVDKYYVGHGARDYRRRVYSHQKGSRQLQCHCAARGNN